MQSEPIKKIKLVRKAAFVSLVAVLCGVTLVLVFSLHSTHILTIGKNRLYIDIAKTVQEKQAGLCCRDFLPENKGMLFVYNKSDIHQFWMKDTRIPLDMYWISSDKKIIYIQPDVQPNTYPKRFGPHTPARYILETNAGYASRHNISVGDSVQF